MGSDQALIVGSTGLKLRAFGVVSTVVSTEALRLALVVA
jgi:hypothetical protein